QAGDWLDALSLYRLLNALHDPRSPYREQADRIAQRVRVLRIYAPARLNELYLTRAKRLGEENPEPPIAIGADTWIERLKGVRVEMLNDGLQNAATRHVTAPGYQPLMLGAIDALRIMI